MNNAQFLHPATIALFMGIFTLLSVMGLVVFVKRRRHFQSALLLVSVLVFGYCTFIAATF
jgi:LPXTG-motif cell wall-anchored protein